MSINIEELDYQQTSIGELILRRRRFPATGQTDVFEVILNDEFLMSSLFTAGEIALAELGLAFCDAIDLDIIVGGLGLGYTAAAALEDNRVQTMTVIEALPSVISWHQQGRLPVSKNLTGDPRCNFHANDFFALAANKFSALKSTNSTHHYHAILLDIDHSPSDVLRADNQAFYTASGLTQVHDCLHDSGVFALWSNDPPEESFALLLSEVFPTTTAHVIPVDNPLTGIEGHNTIYLARR